MLKERVSDNVYWFQSETYAQVTAGTIVGPQWAVLIDTLIPSETPKIRNFIENHLMVPVKYIINTHHHADHCWGNCVFPNATIIGHQLCRDLMLEKGSSALAEAGQENSIFRDICISPPQVTFTSGSINLRIGKKQLQIFSTPCHSADSISVLLEDERILFAGDAFMPVPYFVGGDLETLAQSITHIGNMGLENIVQGHGDIILRGEIEEVKNQNLDYLRSLQKIVKTAIRRRNPLEFLAMQDIEDTGKHRVSLGGLAQDLHVRNLQWLYYQEIRKQES